MGLLLINVANDRNFGHHLHIKQREAQLSNGHKTNIVGRMKHTKYRMVSTMRNSNGLLSAPDRVENIKMSQKRFEEEYGQIQQLCPLLINTLSTPLHTPASMKTPIRLLGDGSDCGRNHNLGECI